MSHFELVLFGLNLCLEAIINQELKQSNRKVSMTGSLARYHGRQPRYVLDANDNNLIRYSGADRHSWEEKTELKNISLTGLSFSAPIDIKPQLGEIIRIQFQVPSAETMACHAIVTRIENINSYECEIAVHFYKLERLQRITLVQGLTIKNMHKSNLQNDKDIQVFKKWQRAAKILAVILAAALWTVFLKIFFFR